MNNFYDFKNMFKNSIKLFNVYPGQLQTKQDMQGHAGHTTNTRNT